MTYQFIEINKLFKSKQNARRTAEKGAAEDLKASIEAHGGIFHNLVVTACEDGSYQVIDGGRRLEAIKALQAEGKLPADYAVPCEVRGEETALEISLAANTIRLAMHPADEYEAFARLAESGYTPEQISTRFGRPVKQVQQRLTLGNADPRLLKEYRAEKLTLDCLMAFCLTDDRKRQMKVYRSLEASGSLNPRAIRAALTESMMEASSKLARFVGLDAYRAAGGTTQSDLFSETVYLENPDLLTDLATARLADIRLELEAEGWGWIEVSVERDWSVVNSCGHIHPQIPELPPELATEREQAERKLAQIEEALEDTESDALIEAMEAAQATLAEIEQRIESLAEFDPEEVRLAGCYVSIGHDGSLLIEKGLVRKQDMKRLASRGEQPERGPKGMPESLKRDLEAYRLQIAQAEIARHPAIAFDLLVFHVACGMLSQASPTDGPDVSFKGQYVPTALKNSFSAEVLGAIRRTLPLHWMEFPTKAARFAEFRTLPESDKLGLLAYCTGMTLKPKLAPAGDGEPTAYDLALALTGVDVAGHWRPTAANYLGRITRDQLLALGRELLGDAWASAHYREKKGDLAGQLERAFAAPEKYGRNPQQVEALMKWLPDGMAFTPTAEAPKAKKNARKAT